MKKILILSIFILISLNILPAVKKEDKTFIKRTILILPFQNKNNVAEYDYLSDVLMDALRAELSEQNKYNFANYDKTNQAFNEIRNNKADVMNFEVTKKIAYQFSADVIITGQYVVSGNELMILLHAVDVISGDIVAVTKVQGELGVNIFNLINTASKDLTNKVITQLRSITRSDYENLFKRLLSDKRLSFINLPARKKLGFGFTVAGGTLLLIGAPIFIYDLAGYSQIMLANKNQYLDTNENHDIYQNSYNIFVSLFSVSLSLMGLGVIFLAVGLPLMLVNIPQKKVSLNLDFENNGINFSLSFRFN
jgi:TolB-like protein